MGVTEDNTDLGRGGTLLGQLADVVDNLLGGGLQPRGRSAGVGNSRGRNALALGVKTTHFAEVSGEESWSAVVELDGKIQRWSWRFGREENCVGHVVIGFAYFFAGFFFGATRFSSPINIDLLLITTSV